MDRRKRDAQDGSVASMNREALTEAILTIDCGFPVDLTPEALDRFSLERLRHVYMAMQMHAMEPVSSG